MNNNKMRFLFSLLLVLPFTSTAFARGHNLQDLNDPEVIAFTAGINNYLSKSTSSEVMNVFGTTSQSAIIETMLMHDHLSEGRFKNPIFSPGLKKEIDRLKRKYPDEYGDQRWGRSGHQIATYLVARFAGYPKNSAYGLAYFSQLPDDEKRFSAVAVAPNVFQLKYRKEIMAGLHSLHGGGNTAVVNRQRKLSSIARQYSKLIKDSNYNNDVYLASLGITIHAYGDSYSHTTTDSDGNSKAFGYIVGHLFHGHEPDLIAYNPEKFKQYTCALYKSLSLKNNCKKLTDVGFMQLIENLKKDKNLELPQFLRYAKSFWSYSTDEYDNYGNNADKISKQNIRVIISRIIN